MVMDELGRDPEAMLARLRMEPAAPGEAGPARQGRLRIFLGYAAGVGKTFGMLSAAQSAQATGRSVLAGYVEPHGRPATEALLEGLERLPTRCSEYRGITLQEFDLDAALARSPGLILVDELAHTNAPGSRHARRWQDVRELVEAGWEVWTTLNIQHIESLNDIVAQITGVVVRETLPDHVFDEADDVELVDLPPDDLLARLNEGKIYLPSQARRAMQEFFRKANLVALRELAMRRLADSVNEEVQSARRGQTRTRSWQTMERLLVCVGPSPSSARVIRTARRMAAALHAKWIALHASTGGPLADEDQRSLNRNLRLAEQLGAETVTITGDDVTAEILRYAQQRNVSRIVIGKTGRTPWYRWWLRSVVDRLIAQSAGIDIYVIQGDSEPQRRPLRRRGLEWSWGGLAAALGLLGLATLLSLGLRALGAADADIVMCYLLAVLLSAVWLNRAEALLSACLSVLLFNYLFTEPLYTFVVSDARYILTFCSMFCVALIVSALTLRIRGQARRARRQERRTEALYRVSHALAGSTGLFELASNAQSQLAELLGGRLALFSPGEGGLQALAAQDAAFARESLELETARWVHAHGQAAGLGTDTLPASTALYLPLQGSEGSIGVLAWQPADPQRPLPLEQRQLLDNLATQVALALERIQLMQEAQRILAEAESERLRSALLSAVTHDLRTPLAAISGSAQALQDAGLGADARRELAVNIEVESARLGSLVENLLQLTRLESGSLQVEKQWQPLEELVSSALTRSAGALRHHHVETDIPEGTGMLPLDALLMEQVLVNLLDNAARYTPEGTLITLSARRFADSAEICVADRGPGLAEDELQRIFERFYRSSHVASDRGRGAGLGLAICRAIVQAHGGTISAEQRQGGGTLLRIRLPLEGQPPQTRELPSRPDDEASSA